MSELIAQFLKDNINKKSIITLDSRHLLVLHTMVTNSIIKLYNDFNPTNYESGLYCYTVTNDFLIVLDILENEIEKVSPSMSKMLKNPEIYINKIKKDLLNVNQEIKNKNEHNT